MGDSALDFGGDALETIVGFVGQEKERKSARHTRKRLTAVAEEQAAEEAAFRDLILERTEPFLEAGEEAITGLRDLIEAPIGESAFFQRGLEEATRGIRTASVGPGGPGMGSGQRLELERRARADLAAEEQLRKERALNTLLNVGSQFATAVPEPGGRSFDTKVAGILGRGEARAGAAQGQTALLTELVGSLRDLFPSKKKGKKNLTDEGVTVTSEFEETPEFYRQNVPYGELLF